MNGSPLQAYCREQPWVLKNSLAKITLKNRRARMPYKRFSPTGHTFPVTYFGALFRENEFFQQRRDFTTANRLRPGRAISSKATKKAGVINSSGGNATRSFECRTPRPDTGKSEHSPRPCRSARSARMPGTTYSCPAHLRDSIE